MNDKSARRLHLAVAWTGPLCLLTFFAGWIVLSHNYPPPDPMFTAQELVDKYYAKYRGGIMLGMSLSACFGMFYLPWTCIVSAQMRKIEFPLLYFQLQEEAERAAHRKAAFEMMQREKVPILALMQLSGGLLTAWILVMCPCIWVWCAESAPYGNPETIRTLHFISWYIFNMTWMITAIQYIAIGVFSLIDKQKPLLFPPWLGYLAIGVSITFIPLTFLPYFKSGPFAINGLWAFHLIVAGFGITTLSTSHYVFKEIGRMRLKVSPGIGQSISQSL